MTDDPALEYDRLRYIQLRGDGSKLPAKSWGGYSQDFDAAEHVHTHADVEMHPADNWGVVDIADPDHGSFALLIFDIDIHKAPDGFDVDRVQIPTDTLVTRSQNGGFHVYFAINGCGRGDLNESDFNMTADPGFDIDIRGSAVSHHVVAPADIPGIGGAYEIVNDERIDTYFEPAEAARRIHLDGSPLLEFAPDAVGIDYDFDVPTEAPEDMPTCYHAGLELRKAAPDDHPNTHKVNMLTAACGLGAGYEPETVAGHFCGEYAPVDGGVDHTDREATEYQVGQIDRTGYHPPSEETLRAYGILDEGQSCDSDCPIAYHGPDTTPDLDVISMDAERDPAAEAAAVAGPDPAAETDADADAEPATAETDGGATAASGSDAGPPIGFEERVRAAIEDANNDVILQKTARHRIARALLEEYDFVYPEEGVRGWRTTLYVYDPDAGIYEPRGKDFIESLLERVAGDFVTNSVAQEIVGKVRRMTKTDRDLETDPHRLCVGNGILNLHTGELDPFTPTEYHRTKLDVDWNPDAGAPEAIDGFLHDIVDESDVDTLYRLVAHTLYKEYLDEKAAILIGSGSNGKSMFLSLVERFLGTYNVVHRELQDFDDDGYAANNLQGKMANLATEIGERQLRDTTTFKKLTGRDSITAQVKHEKPVKFENYATLMFATNEMPVFSQDNHAIWRRWLYVDFPYTFDADDADAKDPEPERLLKRRLFQDTEFEALLLRCQQEIQRWYEGEPLFADSMDAEEVRDKMKKAAEPVYAFGSTCLEAPSDADDDVYVEKSVVRAAYKAFADEEDLPRIAENEFGKRLVALRDYSIESMQKRVDGSVTRVYEGIQLSPRGRQVLGIDEPDDEQQTVEDRPPAKPTVMERAQEMVEENDRDPIPKDGLIWACAGDIGKSTAEHAVEELLHQGDLYEPETGKVIPT